MNYVCRILFAINLHKFVSTNNYRRNEIHVYFRVESLVCIHKKIDSVSFSRLNLNDLKWWKIDWVRWGAKKNSSSYLFFLVSFLRKPRMDEWKSMNKSEKKMRMTLKYKLTFNVIGMVDLSHFQRWIFCSTFSSRCAIFSASFLFNLFSEKNCTFLWFPQMNGWTGRCEKKSNCCYTIITSRIEKKKWAKRREPDTKYRTESMYICTRWSDTSVH